MQEAIRTNQQSQIHNWNIETIIAILESVQHESKDGYNISIQLFQKMNVLSKKMKGSFIHFYIY